MTKAEKPDVETPPADEPAQDSGPATVQGDRPDAEEYSTQGKTVVATRRGYAYADSSGSLPIITSAGVVVTKDQAESLVAESKGRVRIVTEEED